MADVTPILINQLTAQTTLSDSDYFIVGGADAKKITVAQMKEALGINALNGNLQSKQNILAKQVHTTDINYIMDAGWYWIDPGVVSNTPGSYWGALEVINSGAVTQRFTTYPNNYTISRIYANSGWTDWRYPNGEIFAP